MTPHRRDQHLIDDPLEWGRTLIRIQDHDPLYSGLARALAHGIADRDQIRRYLIAYWSCYHVGASWFISQETGMGFWAMLRKAAENSDLHPAPVGGRWPRGGERRHWRGQKCVDSVDWFSANYKRPEDAVESLETLTTLKAVEKAVTQWPMFGPWIAFKAADMLERVMGVSIQFPEEVTTMYAEPLKGAQLVADLLDLPSAQAASDYLLSQYSTIPAPPFGDRPCNVQEVETVLCKWKSAYKSGHYYLGKDTEEHRIALEQWGAHDLLQCYPLGMVERVSV